ncbi:MAG TPA: tetratricopeptide repeat protein [Terriglobales bacterium]|nr:tetratricopeptide repeat protein [Terriglobales bacterium]
MTPSLAVANPEQKQLSAGCTVAERRLFLVLASVALLYAFLAGLRTVQDFDLGWQMATARWVIQHHHVPSTDVLSYTMQGQPWIYPVGGGIVFYLAFLLGGYGLISWMGAAACVGTVALLLRCGSAAGAAIAILAVPLIAARTTPRADLFTVVLFAAFLSLLWENYQTGGARLWLLPVLMIAWVNFHDGFVAGLALVLVYVGAELLETVLGAERRRAALARLRRAAPWLLATAPATLINPWGWGIYRSLLVQERANATQRLWINEWAPVPVNWATLARALYLRQTWGTIYLLLAVAALAAGLALLRAHWTAALLLLGAMYPAVHAVRMGAVFACMVVVVGGPEISTALAGVARWLRPPGLRWSLAGAVVLSLAALAGLRSFDLVTNRHYMATNDEAVFGAGLCSWFPQGAADFITRQKLPGEVLNTYAAGGFLAWRLGPERRVYIDGRDTLYGPPRLARYSELTFTSPDSSAWQQEVARYNINTVIIALARYDGLQPALLHNLCNSTLWRPVYLDERSAVFVRQLPENEMLIQRFPVNCATAPLPATPAGKSGAEAFNTWANAAITLAALGRNSEALAAYQQAFSIFPDSAYLHRNRADLLFVMGHLEDAEQEYRTAIRLGPSADIWGALAHAYLEGGRLADAAQAMEQTAQFSPRPFLILADLGYVYLSMHEPEKALRAFDEAARRTPGALRTADQGYFECKVAQGRSAAWSALGNLDKATAYQEEATRLQPNAPQPWERLATLYQVEGRDADAQRARQRAAELGGR